MRSILKVSYLLPAFLLVTIISKAQLCNLSSRFDQEIFATVVKTSDVTFGANNDYQGVNTILKMDIYQPSGDTASIRPLIVFAHGGSFIAGDKTNIDQVNLCTHFAKRVLHLLNQAENSCLNDN